ncbi:uncharacterized protein LOC122048058 [Zingiber officinale]|uniref:Uncharacterized protein n=1 Tax=Zingiber officinale TaxID=94328 RepID=A0A8J5HPU3_ZINOF|nr:uncharacterized protein LOC122048058 [Zingiber officinale]KAG6523084.1 hypothetical protein ZIOFF_012937 [Zingiber officinale]
MSNASEFRWSRRGYRRLSSRQHSFDLAENAETTVATTTTTPTTSFPTTLKRSKTTRDVKAHPVMRILQAPSKKETARPEFLRYLEYVREAGSWDPTSDKPTIYFK